MPTASTEGDRLEGCDILQWTDIAELKRRHVAQNQPVVIRGAREAHDLGIFSWSSTSLRERLGSQPVPIVDSPTPFLSYERDLRKMPFEDFVNTALGDGSKGRRFLYFKNSTELLPEGLDDSDGMVELADYLRRTVMRNLWISGSGITVGLHFDPAENLNLQLRGRKRFTLHPPGVRALYPMPMFSQTSHISRVFRDGPEPDLSRFPRFDPSRTVDVVLEEGDMLYLPAYWWHQVESLGSENLNLNFWWLPPLRKQLAHPNQALRGYAGLLIRRLKFGTIERADRQTTGSGDA